MEHLQYVIEDSTIAYLLGVNNFTNDESAILELVKNSYDAGALHVNISFSGDQLVIADDGQGMDENNIRTAWMHVGKSDKSYEIFDANNRKRVLAGSKGVGRFALARLGNHVMIQTKKDSNAGIIWETDWNSSSMRQDSTKLSVGTTIKISGLREKWGKKKIENLVNFLSKTYNDRAMNISVTHPDFSGDIPFYLPQPVLGVNCLSCISINYNSHEKTLNTVIDSDEFLDSAQDYCPNINLQRKESEVDIVTELTGLSNYDLTEEQLEDIASQLGDFSGTFFFCMKPSSIECEKFLYKHHGLPAPMPGGVILYRNAFSISAYDGKKDWLGFGKRSRKSPAAASHPTGAWRVRENQISGKIEIDKRRNAMLQDLSNRQGLDENIYYQLFVDIILLGFKEFERYRQDIVRHINVKNESVSIPAKTPVSDKVVQNPKLVPTLTVQESMQLADEIKSYRQESQDARQERTNVEERYKYDIRILNVLATTGLKASSIAHEMRKDRNSISANTDYIIAALQEYGMWDELLSPEKTKKAYKNVPVLLEKGREKCAKIVSFMDTMLSEIEKRQFQPGMQSIIVLLNRIKESWERDYAWISICIRVASDIEYYLSEDVLHVIFDNLILNSIQQNEKSNHLNIIIQGSLEDGLLKFSYSDNGVGLARKYQNNPMKILEVHETTRKNGHGLGMWIVNNTVNMSGGQILDIRGTKGFFAEFSIGGSL